MTALPATPTHRVYSYPAGWIPVVIVDETEKYGRPLLLVEAVAGRPFRHSENSGERQLYPPAHVYPIEPVAEAEADIEIHWSPMFAEVEA